MLLKIVIFSAALSCVAVPALSGTKIYDNNGYRHPIFELFCKSVIDDAANTAFQYGIAQRKVKSWRNVTGTTKHSERNQRLQNLANLAVSFQAFCSPRVKP